MPRHVGWVLVGLLAVGCASGARQTRSGDIWDPAAAAEAEATLHRLHHAWDAMDVAEVEKAIADDGFLSTFEFTDDGEAVRLGSKAELLAWLQKGFDDIKARQANTVAIPQSKMQCRATSNLAVCTEECDIIVRRTDGTSEVTPHRGTSILRKGADGWKFTHWHVSEAGHRKLVDARGVEIAGR